jgi:hypothetical protein
MSSLFARTPLQTAFAALRDDLVHEDGPQISTIRNSRFAILPYAPEKEFELRGEVQKLATTLVGHGWTVLTISLEKLLLDRVRAQGADWVARVTEQERGATKLNADRGLNHLKSKLAPLIEGEAGIAADCSRIICDYADQHPDRIERTVALIGRAGSLYPFFRSSALLRNLDQKTRNVPVVLLYPGECVPRNDHVGLSFMGVLDADHDYRPRIYQ